MTTVGSVTPEWDPPYQSTTIRGVRYKPVFDGRVPPEHIWGGQHGGPQRGGFGRVERSVVDATSFALFRDGEFVLPMRFVLGARPAVSLRDLIGLIARDADVERNTDVIRETRDMIEHMLELHPDSETDTLMPLVPGANLRRVLRVLAGIIPVEIERFRRSADSRWLVEQLGSDAELAATLGQSWATADTAVEPSFVETEGSLDELLVGPEEEDEGLPARWKYCVSAKALAGRKQYTGRGAGCAPQPADHYGAMIRSGSDYYMPADRLKQVPSNDWAYTAATQTLSPRDKMTNFALDHVGKHEQMTARGRRSISEQVSTTEKGKLPLWRRPHPRGGRTARARLEGSTRAVQAAEALDDALAHTWKNSTKNESWQNKDTSLRAETAETGDREAREMPDGCGIHPAPPAPTKGGGRTLLVGQDVPEWSDTLRNSDVSSLRTKRFTPAETEDVVKHPAGWRYSNKGKWGEQGTQELDTVGPSKSEPGHGGAPFGTLSTKDIGQKNVTPEATWRYAMQSKELSADKPAAHPRGHTDSAAATQGPGAISLAAPSHEVESRAEYAARYSMTHRPSPPADPDTDPEDLERVGQLWRLRGAVPPGRLWSPSKRDAALEQKPTSVHEASPSGGGGTSSSVQEFRRSLHEVPDHYATISHSESWKLSSTQRTLDCNNPAITPHADTAMSPRGGHLNAHENLVDYLAMRSPPNKRPPVVKAPAAVSPRGNGNGSDGGRFDQSNFSHAEQWYAEKLSVETESKTKTKVQQQREREQPSATAEEQLGWSYSTQEEETLPPEQRLWGNTVKSVHEKPKATQPDEQPSWSRGRGTNVTTLW